MGMRISPRVFLPVEIVCLIASFVSSSGSLEERRTTLVDIQAFRLVCKTFSDAALPYLMPSILVSTALRDCERLAFIANRAAFRRCVVEIRYNSSFYTPEHSDIQSLDAYKTFIRRKKLMTLSPRATQAEPRNLDFTDEGLERGFQIWSVDYERANNLLYPTEAYNRHQLDDESFIRKMHHLLTSDNASKDLPQDSVLLATALQRFPNVRSIVIDDACMFSTPDRCTTFAGVFEDRPPRRRLRINNRPINNDPTRIQTRKDGSAITIEKCRDAVGLPRESTDRAVVLQPASALKMPNHGVAWAKVGERAAKRALVVTMHAVTIAHTNPPRKLALTTTDEVLRSLTSAEVSWVKYGFANLESLDLRLYRIPSLNELLFAGERVAYYDYATIFENTEQLQNLVVDTSALSHVHRIDLCTVLGRVTFPKLHSLTLIAPIAHYNDPYAFMRKHSGTLRTLKLRGCLARVPEQRVNDTTSKALDSCGFMLRQLRAACLSLENLEVLPFQDHEDMGFHGHTADGVHRFLEANGRAIVETGKLLLSDDDF